MKNTPVILLVDDEPELRELMRMVMEANFSLSITEARNGREAVEILKNQPIDIVVCDYRMDDGNGADVYRHIRETGKDIPYILVTAESLDVDKEYVNNPPAGYVQKPLIVKPLLSVLEKVIQGDVPNNSTKTAVPAYCKILFPTLVRMQVLHGDLYLRLGEGHFVKMMNSGETFNEEDSRRFAEKNVECAYFKAAESHKVLASIEKSLSALASVSHVPAENALQDYVAPSLQMVRDLRSSFGWDENLERVVAANVNVVVSALAHEPELGPLIKKLLRSQKGVAEYASAVAFVSCGIVQSMGWVSDLTNHKLTLAAMLQDMTLTDEQFKKFTDPALANSDDAMRAFIAHPLEAAKLLGKWKGAPPDVDTIIMQHHEKPDGTGFPYRLSYSRISPLAAVQIVARDLVDYHRLHPAQDGAFAPFFEERRTLYSHGVFKKILSALVLLAASQR